MSEISTHILDTARGLPAAGVDVTLCKWSEDSWNPLNTAVTDSNGRISNLCPDEKSPTRGLYKLRFAIDEYFATHNSKSLYPWIEVTFRIEDIDENYHIPLLLADHGYTTYRGS